MTIETLTDNERRDLEGATRGFKLSCDAETYAKAIRIIDAQSARPAAAEQRLIGLAKFHEERSSESRDALEAAEARIAELETMYARASDEIYVASGRQKRLERALLAANTPWKCPHCSAASPAWCRPGCPRLVDAANASISELERAHVARTEYIAELKSQLKCAVGQREFALDTLNAANARIAELAAAHNDECKRSQAANARAEAAEARAQLFFEKGAEAMNRLESEAASLRAAVRQLELEAARADARAKAAEQWVTKFQDARDARATEAASLRAELDDSAKAYEGARQKTS